MSRRRLTYRASKNGETAIIGRTEELAEYFHVIPSTIGNYERTGRKLHKEYAIERIAEGGADDNQNNADISR